MSNIFGTKEVEVAPVEATGLMPADGTFAKLCDTYRDTVEIMDDDPDIQEEYSDQQTEPIEVFTEEGKTKGKFSTFQFDTATLKKLFPTGTIVDGKFTFGKNLGFETALRFKTDSGHMISFPKVKMFAKKSIGLQKKKLGLIDVSFTPMSQPTIEELP